MSLDISALNPKEKEYIKEVLQKLLQSLERRRTVGSNQGSLLTDEELVYNALRHPERGDVEIKILHEHDGMHLFISNRRDPDNPFSVMNLLESHKHPERRPVDSSSTIKENEYGIFLTSFQDRDMLKQNASKTIQVFSTHFGIGDAPAKITDSISALKGKRLEDCTPDEKLRIFQENAPGDARIEKIKDEFFGMRIPLHKYKQNTQDKTIFLIPDNARNIIGQLIRDAYPYGIRKNLRSNYPKEHKLELAKVHKLINSLISEIELKKKSQLPQKLQTQFQEIQTLLDDILENDPELSHYV